MSIVVLETAESDEDIIERCYVAVGRSDRMWGFALEHAPNQEPDRSYYVRGWTECDADVKAGTVTEARMLKCLG